MPKLKASADEVKGNPPMREGLVTVRLDGFEPKYSKDRGSINLNPKMKVINHSEYNDRVVFENWNTKAKWLWPDYCHAFGVQLPEVNGDFEWPGDFDGPDDDPTKWQYRGPLLGQTAQIMLIQADNTKGSDVNKVKFYVCKVPGCALKHSANLVK